MVFAIKFPRIEYICAIGIRIECLGATRSRTVNHSATRSKVYVGATRPRVDHIITSTRLDRTVTRSKVDIIWNQVKSRSYCEQDKSKSLRPTLGANRIRVGGLGATKTRIEDLSATKRRIEDLSLYLSNVYIMQFPDNYLETAVCG